MSLPDYMKDSGLNADQDPLDVSDQSKTMVTNNGFFPDLSLQDLQSRYAIDSSYSISRQLHLLKSAMHHVNIDLEKRYCYWSRQSYATLSTVPQQQYGNEGELVNFYCQAVYAKTMELLIERYRSTDTSRYGLKKAEAKDIDETGRQYETEYRQAIRNIVGQRGQSVFSVLI